MTVAKKLDGEDVAKRDEEEQIVIEATIRARKDSVSSVQSCGSSSVLMTPDERQNLEREMRSQSSHPIMTQIRRDEDERRDMHDREYNRRTGERYSMFQREFLMRRRMDALNNLDDDAAGSNSSRTQSASQLGRPGAGGLNDLFLIEAALLLSMQNDRGSSSSSRPLEVTNSASTTTSASVSAGENSNNDPTVRRNPLLRASRALMQQRSRNTETQEGDNFNRAWDYPDRNLDPLIRSGFLGEGFPSYSDDDQMAMAIAMSLREEEANQERARTQQRVRDAQENQIAEQLLEEHFHTNDNDNDNDNNHDDSNDATGNGTSSDGESQGQILRDSQAQDPNTENM